VPVPGVRLSPAVASASGNGSVQWDGVWHISDRLPMRLFYHLTVAVGLTAGLCLATGCRREIPENELGRVLDHVPDLPGMDKPYDLRPVPRNLDAKKGKTRGPQAGPPEASKAGEPTKRAPF
jgi:hypothetical protein